MAKEFQSNGIRKATLNDIYNKDEKTGRVMFNNPDDPSRPFQNRQDAQAWVDSYNKQVDDAYKTQFSERLRQRAQEERYKVELLQFAPVYDNMSRTEQGIFDKLVEPYAVKDSQGRYAGFKCNLQTAAAQARSIASSVTTVSESKQVGQSVQIPNSQPAQSSVPLDMKSGASTTTSTPKEPRNLEEALKMVMSGGKEK